MYNLQKSVGYILNCMSSLEQCLSLNPNSSVWVWGDYKEDWAILSVDVSRRKRENLMCEMVLNKKIFIPLLRFWTRIESARETKA